MKKILIRVAIALAVVLVVGLVAVFLSLNSIVTKGVNTIGPSVTKVETRISGATISPFSGSGSLLKLFVGNPADYKTPSAIEAGKIEVSVRPGSLFGDKVVVERVHVEAPLITFEGGITGNNLSKILANIQSVAGGDGGSKDGTASAKSQRKLQINDLLIDGGQIRVSLTGLGGQAVTVPLPEIHLQNLGTGDQGITAADVSAIIMKEVLKNVVGVVEQVVLKGGGAIQGVGKGAIDQGQKAVKGLKDLFKP
jgi:hypothetical protein